MKKPIILSVIAGFAVSTAVVSEANAKPKWAKEKCQGVARAGQNDCGANGHSCSGQAKKDNDPKEWVYTPEGLCKKIAGGTVKKS